MNNRKRLIIGLFAAGALLVFAGIAFAIENGSSEFGFGDESLTVVEKASSDQSLSKNGSVTLDRESYAFKGKEIKPKVVVYCDGKKIKKNKDYTLEFSNNDAIGFGKVTAVGKGNYSGSITCEYPIVPQPVKIKKILKIESGFEAQWKAAKDADGYEIEYSLNSDFSDSEVTKIEGNANNTFKKTYLESLKKYYIRLRSYKIVSSHIFYSSWSKTSKFVVGKSNLKKGLYMVIDLASGSTSSKYPISYLDSPPPGGWTEEYKTTKMVLRLVSAGTFIMGSPETELGHIAYEKQHQVTLTRPFYIGVFEVTQRQYALIAGADSSVYLGTTRPVDDVHFETIRGKNKGNNWPKNNEVDEDSFLGKLRARTNECFDLPTEAQWEYACRANTVTALNNGRDLEDKSKDSTLDLLGRYKGNGGTEKDLNNKFLAHVEVGSYIPNAWGLYDMHGNVSEAILDWDGSYDDGPAVDPVGSTTRTSHRHRGGSWSQPASGCRSAERGAYYSEGTIGFRLVLVQ